MEILASARKHWVSDEDTFHAVRNALAFLDLPDAEAPARSLIIGPDRAGNLLEVVVLHLDDSRNLVIHSMPLRKSYRVYLP